MKINRLICFFGILVFAFGNCSVAEESELLLLKRAKRERAPRYQAAVQEGAQIGMTPEGQSFYVLWLPPGSTAEKMPPMVVTISGHDGWAFDDFYVWKDFVKKRGYGLLAIQWWMGTGEEITDYLTPDEIYKASDAVLSKLKVKPGTVMFHGFSRGSTNTYAVAAIDRFLKKNYFALIVANSGKASSGYPPTRAIEDGQFGNQPLSGTKWVTFAGALDANPERDGIPGMRETAQWIQRMGGTVELAIEDQEADHGGFHRRPQNADAALDVFEKVRVKE